VEARTGLSRKGRAPSRLIDSKIGEQGDWRVKTLSQLRALIKEADPVAVEEVKWRRPANPMGVPVWSHDGIVCTGAILKNAVRLTFFKGAQLKDPKRLFNASLQGNALRAIDFHQGDTADEASLKALVLEAVTLNMSKMRKRSGL
jgi:hypothetical protein